VAALDDSNDVLARAELAGHGLHAEDAGVGATEGVENLLGGAGERAGRKIFEKETLADGAAFRQRGGEARGDRLTGNIGDESDTLAGLNGEAGVDGVARAGKKLRLNGSKIHRDIVNRLGEFCYWIEAPDLCERETPA
jgi:hypothetical protein